ncbi:MAG: hypothetical protein AB7U30_04825 [Sulfuricellaceae bacterium]|jgi:hypothetical protein
MFRPVAMLGLLLASGGVHAARPMVTDDARITDAKSCQLETWVKGNTGSTEYWALPACNFSGNLEVTVGGARTSDEAGTRITDLVFQGKTLFKTLQPNGWSWGLAFGNARHPDAQNDGSLVGDLYAYLPASFSFRDDHLVLHTNVGWLREKENGRQRMTWGLGSEGRLARQTWLIAEVFGQNQGKPFYQVGVRHWIIPDRMQIDTTYGNEFGSPGAGRWFSIGLRLLSPAFLP